MNIKTIDDFIMWGSIIGMVLALIKFVQITGLS